MKMNLDFNISENNHSIIIEEKFSYYQLIVSKEVGAFRFKNIYFIARFNGTEVNITGRDLGEYHPSIRNATIKPGYQLLEVGAGFGEFVPHLVKSNNNIEKPIVIDPVNYNLILSVLLYASKQSLGDYAKERINAFTERAEIIIDPTNVRLFNTTLGEALKQHQDLEGIADVVIDNYGPVYYEETELEHTVQYVRNLEERLCKKGGILIRA